MFVEGSKAIYCHDDKEEVVDIVKVHSDSITIFVPSIQRERDTLHEKLKLINGDKFTNELNILKKKVTEQELEIQLLKQIIKEKKTEEPRSMDFFDSMYRNNDNHRSPFERIAMNFGQKQKDDDCKQS
jgi:hypothetical protein